jgi:hypothetical protein
MQAPELHVTEGAEADRDPAAPSGGHRAADRLRPVVLVAALTVVGAVLRLVVAHQSVFADELSTYWIVAHRGLGGVISTVHTDAEISPPLSFVATWLTTQLGLSPELLRAPALVAGVAAIPLVFLVGVRTVGRRAALVAAALTTLSPFMTYYGAEARGYGLMVTLVLLSTLALLQATQTRRVGWWVLYGVATCAAAYTHYTSVFALAAQLLWLWFAHPEARRPALVANGLAVIGFLPWLSGLRGDLDSPTTSILSDLQTLTPDYVRTAVGHWAVGFPYARPLTRITALPGVPGLVLLAVSAALGLAGLVAQVLREGARRPRPSPGIVLVVALALSAPVGEALASAAGSNLFGVRNLAASWPALALTFAALLVGAGRRLGAVAAALAIAAFAISAVKMLGPDFRRPDYRGAAAFIDARAAPGDVIVDGGSVTPAGMPGALVPVLDHPRRIFYLGRDRVRYDPFRILSLARPAPEVVQEAARAAAGRRVFILLSRESSLVREAPRALPEGYRRTATWTARGLVPLVLLTYERPASPPG